MLTIRQTWIKTLLLSFLQGIRFKSLPAGLQGFDMLARLRELHADILNRIGDLEQLIQAAEPQIDRVMVVRHGLTRASRARTMLLETRIYPELLAKLSDREAGRVRALQAEGKELLAASSKHIGRWSLKAITEEWDEYRRASDMVRPDMRRRIRSEQEILYPLLKDL